MIILRNEEVNLKKILERFDKGTGKYHEVELGCPNIGKEWGFEEQRKIHPEDWRTISAKILEDYKNTNYDLIIASADIADRTFRTAHCFSDAYKRKL